MRDIAAFCEYGTVEGYSTVTCLSGSLAYVPASEVFVTGAFTRANLHVWLDALGGRREA